MLIAEKTTSAPTAKRRKHKKKKPPSLKDVLPEEELAAFALTLNISDKWKRDWQLNGKTSGQKFTPALANVTELRIALWSRIGEKQR